MKGKTWIITKWTKEITDSGKDETINKKPDNMDCKFRLLDGDGNIYAYGYSMVDDDENAFEPLDYYENDYGVVEIQYKNKTTGIYETL